MAGQLLPWHDRSWRNQSGRRWICSLLAAVHLLAIAASGTLRGEHVIADAAVFVVPWINARGAQLAFGALPLWAAGALMDAQRFFIHFRGAVHTGDVWTFESRVFPAFLDGRRTVWAEYFSAHHTLVLDAATGFAYATYLFVFIGLTIYLYLRGDVRRFEQMCWGFLLVSCIGVAMYLLFPLAPPWYIIRNGTGAVSIDALGSAAGAARFDALFSTTYFEQFYGRSPNVFGAMPSLHVAYPALIIFIAWERGRWWQVLSTAYVALVAFSAVYLSHHYIVDTVVGFAMAAAVAAFLRRARQPETLRAAEPSYE